MEESLERTEEELSALELIYSDEVNVTRYFQSSERNQNIWIADIVYRPGPGNPNGAEETKPKVPITVKVKIPIRYPEGPVEVEAVGPYQDIQMLTEELQLFSQQNLGTHDLYSLFELAREWLDRQEIKNSKAEGLPEPDEQDAHPLCKFYLQGKCRFDDKCLNRHDQSRHSEEAIKELSLHDQIETRVENSTLVKKKCENNESYRTNEADKMSLDGTTNENIVSNKETSHIKCRESMEPEPFGKKKPMKTATDVISRIMWDDVLHTESFTVGYIDRFIGIVEKPFTAFSWEDIASVDDYFVLAIPKHRIQYFKYKDVIVWDKTTRTDKVFGSTGDQETITDIIDADKSSGNSLIETNTS